MGRKKFPAQATDENKTLSEENRMGEIWLRTEKSQKGKKAQKISMRKRKKILSKNSEERRRKKDTNNTFVLPILSRYVLCLYYFSSFLMYSEEEEKTITKERKCNVPENRDIET